MKIKLIAPPMYVMTCMTLDKELGLETMNQCIEAIATVIRAKGYVILVILFVRSGDMKVLVWKGNLYFTSLVCCSFSLTSLFLP